MSFMKWWKVSVWSFADYAVANNSHHDAEKRVVQLFDLFSHLSWRKKLV